MKTRNSFPDKKLKISEPDHFESSGTACHDVFCPPKSNSETKPPTLALCSVSKSYDGHPVLSNLSMEFSDGTFYCLMAPSGSGKTTLFRLILGLEQPDSGTIQFHLSESPAALRQETTSGSAFSARRSKGSHHPIPAVFQEDRLLEGYTAIENLRFALGKRYSNETLTAYLLRLLPEDALNKPVCEFSGGMKRRVSILRAILAPSEIILMDEPFTGLDTDTKQAAIDLIKELCAGKLVIIATHAEQDAELLNARIIHL